MIDLTSVAEVEAAFDNVRAFYKGEVVDVLNRGEVAVVAESCALFLDVAARQCN
jgi:hypothetical protein